MELIEWLLVIGQILYGLFTAYLAVNGFYVLSKKPTDFNVEMLAFGFAFVGSVGAASAFALLPWTIYMISG